MQCSILPQNINALNEYIDIKTQNTSNREEALEILRKRKSFGDNFCVEELAGEISYAEVKR